MDIWWWWSWWWWWCQMSWNVKCQCQSMTPSRNDRRYILRSVQSSPGRSFLAPKELYTWYCPMTIRPLFENTPVLDNNLNINALMTLTMMNKITRNVKWHKISNGTKCQMTQNVKWHKVSNDTKCQMTQNIKWHKMSNDTKFQMTRNDTWHMTYDTWQMTNKTWQMTHETKFQIAHYTHDTWHMIHDTWHMRYDVWCMTHDAWWSMTPDRNTRRHTLRSVHSSPGRPFLAPQELL